MYKVWLVGSYATADRLEELTGIQFILSPPVPKTSTSSRKFLPFVEEIGRREGKVVDSDRIPKELIVGEVYSSVEILGFILDNDITVLCNSVSYFNEHSDLKFLVKESLEAYVHRSHPRWTYQIPSSKSKIIKIERV